MTDCCEAGGWWDDADAEKINYVHGVIFLRMDEPEDKFMTGVEKAYME